MTIFNINLDSKGEVRNATRTVRFIGDDKELLMETDLVWNSKNREFEMTLRDKLKMTAILFERQVRNNGKNETVITMATTNAAIHALVNRDLKSALKALAGTYVALVGVYSVAGLTIEIVDGAFKAN